MTSSGRIVRPIAHKHPVPALLIAAVAAGCVSGGESERAPRPSVQGGEFGTPGCFPRRLVQDFEVLDDRNLIVFAPGRPDAYHVQVSPPAGQLRFVRLLTFQSPDSRICGYAGDGLIMVDAGTGTRRLSVTGSYRLDEAALRGLEYRFGMIAPPGQSVASPESVEGVEIERDLDSGPEE